jgi:hypothetical protein
MIGIFWRSSIKIVDGPAGGCLSGEDLILKIQSFLYVLRRGRREQILAALVIGSLGLAAWLRTETKDIPFAAHSAYLVYGLSVLFAALLVLRLWRQAVPPPVPPAGPIPAAVKGLFPFTIADGVLFARLGRRTELQYLIGLAQNEQVAVSVVRGQSGAGKTSLLQAGVGYSLGKENFIYWEAVPTKAPEALLHAVRNRFADIDSLESLPEKIPSRCVLVLDQFEQLNPGNPEHASVFELLKRVATSPSPHRLSIIAGFRREFAADWLDFEEANQFRAEQVSVNLLPDPTAKDTIVVLAGEAGFTLDNALVDNFIAEVRHPDGISPVDIAIGVLSLANFVQQRGITHVAFSEYKIAGGAQGLLQSFVQEKLEEIPEQIQGPLLKGMVLTLVDLSNDQRIAEGATAGEIAAMAEMPETSLTYSLERFTHPRIRLLDKPAPDRYRLPHERLVPVLRRLTGTVLASRDQARLTFEHEFARWRETRNQRHLLGGKELSQILGDKEQFVQGEDIALKTEYLNACLNGRTRSRLVPGTIMILLAATTCAVLMGHRSHTVAGLLQSRASDQWSAYQSKKGRMDNLSTALDLLAMQPTTDPAATAAKSAEYKAHIEKWRTDLDDEQKMARELESEQLQAERKASRFDLGATLLEIALVLSTITFFTSSRVYLYLGLLIGTVGILIASTALLVR